MIKKVVNDENFPARLLVAYATAMTTLKLEDQVTARVAIGRAQYG